MIWLGLNVFFLKFADENFVVCYLVIKQIRLLLGRASVTREIDKASQEWFPFVKWRDKVACIHTTNDRQRKLSIFC